MPMERLDIGEGPEESRLARAWRRTTPSVRRGLVALVAVGLSIGVGVLLARTDGHSWPAATGPPRHVGRLVDAFGPPPWAIAPRQVKDPSFELVNRTDRTVFVSTPPRFFFTIPAHRRLVFARNPVCTYQRFTARFRHGPTLGTIEHFCSAHRWVVLPSGTARLR